MNDLDMGPVRLRQNKQNNVVVLTQVHAEMHAGNEKPTVGGAKALLVGPL